jgi:hypothetical protein
LAAGGPAAGCWDASPPRPRRSRPCRRPHRKRRGRGVPPCLGPPSAAHPGSPSVPLHARAVRTAQDANVRLMRKYAVASFNVGLAAATEEPGAAQQQQGGEQQQQQRKEEEQQQQREEEAPPDDDAPPPASPQ